MDPADPLLPKILVLVILILINAFFAAAEIAVISLSETKLRKQAEEGDKKAKKLLVLMQAPDSFLSAIQIAITLAGFLSSAFAADSFSDPLVHWLTVDKGFTAIPTSTLNTIMVVLITIVLSYFSLVLGELVPKRLAMLTEHRDGLRARIDELRLALAATEYKIAAYTRELGEQAAADDIDINTFDTDKENPS